MQTLKLNRPNYSSRPLSNSLRVIGAIALLYLSVACSSLPKSEETNKVELGMNKKQVIAIMGEPTGKRMGIGREVLSYKIQTENGERVHLVALDDNEVVFSGSQQDYKTMVAKEREESQGDESTTTSTQSNTQTVTVSPTINVPPQVIYQAQPQVIYQQAQPAQAGMPKPTWGEVFQATQYFQDLGTPKFNGAAPMRPMAPAGAAPMNPYYGGQ